MIVVIAGGIGSGKSAVVEVLRNIGAKVVVADEINRELLKDSDHLSEIGRAFPGTVENGTLNKKKLREIIFTSENERKRLNSISHPKIFKRINDLTLSEGLIFVEVPLLEETLGLIKFDKICAVKAPIQVRAKRVSLRDNISLESALKIIEVQAREEEIYNKADFIINNDGSLEYLRDQVIKMYEYVR